MTTVKREAHNLIILQPRQLDNLDNPTTRSRQPDNLLQREKDIPQKAIPQFSNPSLIRLTLPHLIFTTHDSS